MSLDKHHLTFSLSLLSSFYIVYITGHGASRTSVDSGYFGVLVILASILTRFFIATYFIDYASILTRYPLTSHFINYDSILALVFMYRISYFMSFTVFMLCVADPSWSLDLLDFGLLLCLHLPYYYFRPVSYMLPFNTCISPDQLTCYSLAGPYWYDLTYPDYYPSIDITCHLIIVNLLYAWLLVNYHHLVMPSLYIQHDIFDL